MKLTVALAAFALFAVSAHASDVRGVLLTNGEVEIADVGSVYAASRTFLSLNNDVESRVLCQVYYRDEEEGDAPADEIDIEQMDGWVNDALETYLQGKCGDMSQDELVKGWQDGRLYKKLGTFSEWVATVLEKINKDGASHRREVSIVAVVIKPFGEFAELVSE